MNTDTVIVGAGTAGLAAAAELGRAGLPAVVLERADAIGAAWRGRYDRLRLNTSRLTSRLPAARYRRGTSLFPTRDEFVRYLEESSDRCGRVPQGRALPRARRLVVGPGCSGMEIAYDLATSGARRVRLAALAAGAGRRAVRLVRRIAIGDLSEHGLPQPAGRGRLCPTQARREDSGDRRSRGGRCRQGPADRGGRRRRRARRRRGRAGRRQPGGAGRDHFGDRLPPRPRAARRTSRRARRARSPPGPCRPRGRAGPPFHRLPATPRTDSPPRSRGKTGGRSGRA